MKYPCWFLLTLFAMPLHANPMDNPLDFIVSTMNHCYEVENKVGIELSKCMYDVLGKVPNPDEYRVIIYEETSDKAIQSDFSIKIFNKNGWEIFCTGKSQKKIDIEKCTTKNRPPLTPAELLSINPP